MPTISEVAQTLLEQHRQAAEANDVEKLVALKPQLEGFLSEAPEDPLLLFTLGTTHLQLGLNGVAITYLKHAAEVCPDLPEIWNNLGTAWKHENHFEPAKECFEKAMSLDERADFLNNLATLYVNEGCPTEGEPFARRALELDPSNIKAHWNLGLLLLEQGKWDEGLACYEWGFASGDRPKRDYGVPEWNGKPGQTVIVYGEQGIGDEIMFASCLPDLMKDCEVIFDCHPRLKGVWERTFGIKCYGGRKKDVGKWAKNSGADASVAIGSLFLHYRRNGEFPRKPYLTADPKLVKQYREKLEALGPGPYVGIGWKGGSKKTRADLRSVKLARFKPLFDQGGTFISVQYTSDSAGKVERFEKDSGVKVHHFPEIVEAFDYEKTVALIEALDLVVCPNTSAVHVCGALGVPCWSLTPNAPAWRYGLSGPRMPMYGDWVQLFREGDSWDALFQSVADQYRGIEVAA